MPATYTAGEAVKQSGNALCAANSMPAVLTGV
jgi:hypothetical protein